MNLDKGDKEQKLKGIGTRTILFHLLCNGYYTTEAYLLKAYRIECRTLQI